MPSRERCRDHSLKEAADALERSYFLLAGAGGLVGGFVKGETVAATFALFCLGFLASRPLRF
jgi:hypothetical protein